MAAVIVAIFGFDEKTPFPSLYALVPVVGVALIILFADAKTIVARFLSQRLMVGVGLISYSAYLWHQPLFAFARIRTPHEPAPVLMGALAVLAFGLAILSWRFVDQPFRHPNPALSSRPRLFAASLAGLIGFITIGGIGVGAKGFVDRFDAANRDKPDEIPECLCPAKPLGCGL